MSDAFATGSMPIAFASPEFFSFGKKGVDQLGNTYKVVKVTENTAVLKLVKAKFWRKA